MVSNVYQSYSEKRTRSRGQDTTWRPGRELVDDAVRTLHTWRRGRRRRCPADVGCRWDAIVRDRPDTPR